MLRLNITEAKNGFLINCTDPDKREEVESYVEPDSERCLRRVAKLLSIPFQEKFDD